MVFGAMSFCLLCAHYSRRVGRYMIFCKQVPIDSESWAKETAFDGLLDLLLI